MPRSKTISISIRKAAELITRFIKPISYKTIFRHYKQGKSNYKFIEKTVRGGPSYQVLISSLPSVIQTEVIASSLPTESKAALQSAEVDRIADLGDEAKILSEVPTWQTELWNKYQSFIIGPYKLYGPKILKIWLPEYKKQNPGLKIAISSIYTARKKYKKHGLSGLLAKWGKNAGKTIVENIDFEIFAQEFLDGGCLPVRECWLKALGLARLRDPNINEDNYPSPAAFMTRLNREYPISFQFLKRYGFDKWNRKYASYVDRDYSSIRAYDCIVSDHYNFDCIIKNPQTGLPCRPWLTCFMDFKTGKMLGWFVHCESPNSDHIFMAFYLTCKAWGLPREILIDCGKDYRARDFAGGRKRVFNANIDPEKAKKQINTLALLNIQVHFAVPYGAQTKNIERAFKVITDSFCRRLQGYTGGSISMRPEKLAGEIKHDDIYKFEDFTKLVDDYITNCFNKDISNGKNLKGRSRDQAWAEEFVEKREVSPEALRLFCLRSSATVTVGRNGIRDSQFGVTYWNDMLSGQKSRRVYIRRDIKNYVLAYVFDANTDEFLCTARAGVFNSPALAKSEVEKSQFIQALAAKKREHKFIKNFAKINKRSDSIDTILASKIGIAAITGETPEADPKIHHIPDTKMDKVAAEKQRLDKEGTHDISDLARELPGTGSGKKLAAWEYEKDQESAQKTA